MSHRQHKHTHFALFLETRSISAANILIAHLPEIKRILLDALDVVFIPKQIASQVVLAVALESSMVTINQLFHILRSLSATFSTHSRLIRQLHSQQCQANTQDEWMDLAEQIDNIQGNDVWRTEKKCALYESDRIQARIDELVHLMRRRDIFDLMFTLRGGIGRNHFGLLHEGLFSRAMAGSKLLIETYHNVVCAALDYVCDAPVAPNDDPIPNDSRLAFFNETRHSYGRTALLCSGGAALGFYHVGVVKALMENGLMPRVLGGSSAGSIVTAIVATRTDEECVRDFFNVKGTVAPGHSGILKTDFFRPVGYAASKLNDGNNETVVALDKEKDGGFKRAFQLFFPLTLRNMTSFIYDVLTGFKRPKDILKSDTRHLEACLRANIGDFTFQEAFDRTGRILNITVSPQSRSDPPRLLNYLTSPHVLIWSAALASSSLPGVFEANRLMVKDADGTERFESTSGMTMHFQDGSMEADLPMQQLSEMFNVNHFIVSQANPHAVMFASFSLRRSVWAHPIVGYINGILLFIKNQLRSYLRNVFDLCGGRRIAPLWDTKRNMGTQFFTQEYEGRDTDVSLIPWQNHRSLTSAMFNLIHNPTHNEFMDWVKAAERETWRHIPRIKSHCAEERTLDRCVQRLRKKIMMESWDKHSSTNLYLPKEGDKDGGLNARTPSFFQSPSLVCLGGLNVLDPFETVNSVKNDVRDPFHKSSKPVDPLDITTHVDATSGWGGLGLHGNHSYTNLAMHRSTSGGSGIFIGDEEENEKSSDLGPGARRGSWANQVGGYVPENYIKTSTMANFYYRKTQSHGNLAEGETEGKGTTDQSGRPLSAGQLTGSTSH
eukprot:CCRYP_021109-RA/>CCRYP_021109-RA protein AED:0.08 eAED:0.08 QI:537/1/1/1/1/1/6/494/833